MAQRITYGTKRAGLKWESAEANQVKTVVNSHATELETLNTNLTSVMRGLDIVNQVNNSVTIRANVLNRWTSPMSSISVTFALENVNKVSEYMLEFTCGSASFTLTLPSGVRWAGEEPDFTLGNTYEISIQHNLAIFAEWEAAQS